MSAFGALDEKVSTSTVGDPDEVGDVRARHVVAGHAMLAHGLI